MPTSAASNRTALLVMDIQERIVAGHGKDPAYLERLQRAIAAARGAGVSVIHVVLSLRGEADGVSASPNNPAVFGAVKASAFSESDAGAKIHAAAKPQPGEIIVAKRRISAFAGSDLDLVLRAKDIDTLVLCGLATSGVILSTLRQASDMDYRLVVLSDGCNDADEELHAVLMTKLFPRQASISTVDEWVASLQGPKV